MLFNLIFKANICYQFNSIMDQGRRRRISETMKIRQVGEDLEEKNLMALWIYLFNLNIKIKQKKSI